MMPEKDCSKINSDISVAKKFRHSIDNKKEVQNSFVSKTLGQVLKSFR